MDTVRIPDGFRERMRHWLGEEYAAFEAGYDRERRTALRVNRLKLSPAEFEAMSPVPTVSVPWAEDGFFVEPSEDFRPGKHPWHHAGLYYMQEGSAMLTAAIASPEPGERVLDLCAAPGGKTTQLASGMQGKGLLVANEIHPTRAAVLSQNVERMGIRNALVTNESPKELAKRFPTFFDKIVVDAPCSGEGMFRKEEHAILDWSVDNLLLCSRRQQEILHEAATMLRPGGYLFYSTCTFAPEENEYTIAAFLNHHPDFELASPEDLPDGTARRAWLAGLSVGHGRAEWVTDNAMAEADGEVPIPDGIEYTIRLWPHRAPAEGHFAAVLHKKDTADGGGRWDKTDRTKRKKAGSDKGERGLSEAVAAGRAFAKEAGLQFPHEAEWTPILFGNKLCFLPGFCALSLDGLRVLRAGWEWGCAKGTRFEPDHALALSLSAKDVPATCELTDPRLPKDAAEAWLRGEVLPIPTDMTLPKGWLPVAVNGFTVSWGKYSDGTLKNHYPKGLRVR
jgi:NOL1/NOP2/sun family putative RNA methylase